MLCILFGVMVAALTYHWIGDWAALAGVAAAAGLFFTMKFWPHKQSSTMSEKR